jgi:ParB-like nuclease domain
MMSVPDYVTVRRLSDTQFGVLPNDLVSDEPAGYDLSLVRSVATEGLTTPIVVQPLPGGRFRVVDGSKRLAAIRILLRMNKRIYDRLRGLMRPAGRVFALVSCRVESPPPPVARRRSNRGHDLR